jgi:Uma2 family endonuclease
VKATVVHLRSSVKQKQQEFLVLEMGMATDFTLLDVEIPPLRDGDRVTRAEFERRWEAMPHVKKAELIDGVIHMPPAALSVDHGTPHFGMITWLGMYQLLTPGVEGSDNASIRFDDKNMPQPDALLRILETHGGQCRVTADRYLESAPELVAEIANTTAAFDLGVKREIYRRFGVREYIVWRVADRVVDWFALRGSKYAPLKPGPDGVIRSEVFPGLWLDPVALVNSDAKQLLSVAQQGHGSPEHCNFIAELNRRAVGR